MNGTQLRKPLTTAVMSLDILSPLSWPSLGTEPEELPGSFGLSARYPRDIGLARDPAVLLAEDSENGAIADLKRR